MSPLQDSRGRVPAILDGWSSIRDYIAGWWSDQAPPSLRSLQRYADRGHPERGPLPVYTGAGGRAWARTDELDAWVLVRFQRLELEVAGTRHLVHAFPAGDRHVARCHELRAETSGATPREALDSLRPLLAVPHTA